LLLKEIGGCVADAFQTHKKTNKKRNSQDSHLEIFGYFIKK